ncbi:MAG: hypothetical protein LBN03_02970 [Bifidobacteriaceae bacterium]|jgi:hypothetical protein|nr:hypothetical protein [Bifidobacteriaceae bacterium]
MLKKRTGRSSLSSSPVLFLCSKNARFIATLFILFAFLFTATISLSSCKKDEPTETIYSDTNVLIVSPEGDFSILAENHIEDWTKLSKSLIDDLTSVGFVRENIISKHYKNFKQEQIILDGIIDSEGTPTTDLIILLQNEPAADYTSFNDAFPAKNKALWEDSVTAIQYQRYYNNYSLNTVNNYLQTYKDAGIYTIGISNNNYTTADLTKSFTQFDTAKIPELKKTGGVFKSFTLTKPVTTTDPTAPATDVPVDPTANAVPDATTDETANTPTDDDSDGEDVPKSKSADETIFAKNKTLADLGKKLQEKLTTGYTDTGFEINPETNLPASTDLGLTVPPIDPAITKSSCNTPYNFDYAYCLPNQKANARAQFNYVKKTLNLPDLNPEGIDDGKVENVFMTEVFLSDIRFDSTFDYWSELWKLIKPYYDSGRFVSASNRINKTTDPQIAMIDLTIPLMGNTAAGVSHNVLTKSYKNINDPIDIIFSQSDIISRGVTRTLTEMGRKTILTSAEWPLITGNNAELTAITDIVNKKQGMSLMFDSKGLMKQIAVLSSCKAENIVPSCPYLEREPSADSILAYKNYNEDKIMEMVNTDVKPAIGSFSLFPWDNNYVKANNKIAYGATLNYNVVSIDTIMQLLLKPEYFTAVEAGL